MTGDMTMAEDKQTLSPAEWKSIGDCVMELSERMEKAACSSEQITAPQAKGTAPTDHRND